MASGFVKKPKNRENPIMSEHFRTLHDVADASRDISYQKISRAVNALEAAGVVHPWRGQNNEIRLTLDDAQRVERVLTLIRNQETVGRAVERLIREQLERRIEQLEAENQELRSLQLIEVKPAPAKRLTGWLRKWYTILTSRR